MTIEEVVRQVLREEHGDVIRESVRAVAQELMEAEVSELIGAAHGERTEDRATHRNGYRARRWDTRAGEIELQIPKIRQGSYFPSFLQPRKRSEQALVSVVQQAYVCGVSTRRVDQLVESLGLRISKSEVSRIAGLLDEQVQAFRQRPLEGRYPWRRGDRGVLARVPQIARHPRADRRRTGDLRRASRAESGARAGPRRAVAALHRALPARSPRPCPPRPARRARRDHPLHLHRPGRR
jgi:mutator family transposase